MTNVEAPPSEGKFQWIKRMGVHYAYHTNRINRFIHWAMIPWELMGCMVLLGSIPIPLIKDPLEPFGSIPSTLVICCLGLIYIQTDRVCGLTAWMLLLGLQGGVYAGVLRWFAWTCQPGLGRLVLGVAMFLLTNRIQTGVGHGKFEPEGRDDTEKNISEYLQTKNLIPLLLIFYYHWVEVLLTLGYRPALRRDIEWFRDKYDFPRLNVSDK